MPKIEEHFFEHGFVGISANIVIRNHIDRCDQLLAAGDFIEPRIGAVHVPGTGHPDIQKDFLEQLAEANSQKNVAEGHVALASLLALSLDRHRWQRGLEIVQARVFKKPDYSFFLDSLGYGEILYAGLQHAERAGNNWEQAQSLDYCVHATQQTVERIGAWRTRRVAAKMIEEGRRWSTAQLHADTL